MIINYFSIGHLFYIFLLSSIAAGLYFLLSKKSEKSKKYTVLSIMLLNVFQHLFKSLIYPQYEGFGFNALNTAYNMCALLILLSPIAFFVKWQPLRNFVFYAGTFAGFIAVLVPYWHIGEYAFTPNVIRFFICHALLFTSSLLMLLLGLHKPSYKCFSYLGLGFLLGVCVVIVNDVIALLLGIYVGFDGWTVSDALRELNPCWAFGVPEGFSLVVSIAKFFLPNTFVGENPSGSFVPVIWYAVPVYLALTLLALPVCVLFDRRAFVSDIIALKKRIKRP